jgi:hypothetical protein
MKLYFKKVRKKNLVDHKKHTLYHFFFRLAVYQYASFDFRVRGNKKISNPKRLFYREGKVESNIYPYIVNTEGLDFITVTDKEFLKTVEKLYSKAIKEKILKTEK